MNVLFPEMGIIHLIKEESKHCNQFRSQITPQTSRYVHLYRKNLHICVPPDINSDEQVHFAFAVDFKQLYFLHNI